MPGQRRALCHGTESAWGGVPLCLWGGTHRGMVRSRGAVRCPEGHGVGARGSHVAPADTLTLSSLPTGCTWEIPWTLLTF